MTGVDTAVKRAARHGAIVLVAWARAAAVGAASAAEIMPALQRVTDVELGAGHEHVVVQDGAAAPLATTLRSVDTLSDSAIALALPAPGELGGLSGATPLAHAALASGAAAGIGPVGLVPTPAQGRLVSWDVFSTPIRPTEPLRALGEVELELADAVRAATEIFSQWGGARLPDQDAVRAARSGRGPALPAAYPTRAQHIVDRAVTTSRVLALANEPPAGAAGTADIDTWWQGIRRLDGICRRAIVTAVNTPL